MASNVCGSIRKYLTPFFVFLALVFSMNVFPAHAAVTAEGNDAACNLLSLTIKNGHLRQGDRFSATFRLTNTGKTIWTSAGKYKIGQAHDNSQEWGITRLSFSTPIAPRQSVDVTGTFT